MGRAAAAVEATRERSPIQELGKGAAGRTTATVKNTEGLKRAAHTALKSSQHLMTSL